MERARRVTWLGVIWAFVSGAAGIGLVLAVMIYAVNFAYGHRSSLG
jgi:hypothetical protein